MARFVETHKAAVSVLGVAASALLGLGVFSYARISDENQEAQEARGVATYEAARAEAFSERVRTDDVAFVVAQVVLGHWSC